MKSEQKKRLIEKFHLLYKIHKLIVQKIVAGIYADMFELLQKCQDCAIMIGTEIDQSVGEGTYVVTLLEEYCELVYQASQFSDYQKLINKMQEMESVSQKAEKCLQQDIKCDKIEIVFFPYKASMWDSLESIWLAAKEDNNCDCYVVPIPYFDKKADGTLGEMHYEGNAFPETVPIVNWQEYDIINRRPDVAYIHNPYDNGNHVTSVHPFYYAKELKKHVGKLIYCPYFVSGETVQKHYCTLPGVLWSDKVIVQSENIRKQYIQYYDKVVSDEQVRAMWGSGEDKFVALGSPKVDKVRFYDKSQEKLPEKWEQLCKGKKIVFYNTHLTEALQKGENFFEKLRSVLTYFEQSEKYVLWWRPHPLSEQTMAAMRPELSLEYEEIVNEYREKCYGIYDDTPEWYRAVAWADVYYGSKGSMLPLFGVTGKPVILQNTNCIFSELNGDKGVVNYEAFTMAGDIVYLISAEIGALVSLNLLTEEWTLVADLPGELQGEISIFSRLFVDEDKIYIFVSNANAHYIYYLKEQRFEKVEWKINGVLPEPNSNVKFAEIFQYKQYFILMPHRFNAILVFNKENGELTAHTEWIEKLKEQIEGFRIPEIYFRLRSVCMVEDKIFAILRRDKVDVICHFSVSGMQLEQIYSFPIEGILQGMEYDGENLWMIHNFGKAVVKWNYRSNSVQSYHNPVIKETIQGLQYRLVLVDNNVYLCPIKLGKSCLCLKNDKLIGVNEEFEVYRDSFQVDGNRVGTIQGEGQILEWKDKDWNTKRKVVLHYPEACRDQKYKEVLLRKRLKAFFDEKSAKYLFENAALQFDEWLELFDSLDDEQWNRQNITQRYISLFSVSSQSAGKLIHNYVMKDLED